MNIKVLIDFEVFIKDKKENETFDKDIELLKKIAKIYPCDLFV